MRIAFEALDFKMKERGVVTLEKLQMEHSALKSLSSEIYLQLSDAGKKMKGEKTIGSTFSHKSASLIMKARIKSNGNPC